MPPKPRNKPNLFPVPKAAPIKHRGDAAAAAAKNRKPSPAILAVRPAPQKHPLMGVPTKAQRRKKIKPPR
jgi:hypothetical protein